MTKRSKYLIIGAACLAAFALCWLTTLIFNPRSDNPEYDRWLQTDRTIGRIGWWERHLPHSVSQWLRLEARNQKYWDKREQLADSLVTSGYLTNLAITGINRPTNGVQWTEIRTRFENAFQHRGGWEFVFRNTNTIVITCRPQDEGLCRQAVTNNPVIVK